MIGRSRSIAELPPGQHVHPFLRPFGQPQYARRMPGGDSPISVRVAGLVDAPFEIREEDLGALPSVERTADFHCVTTWSVLGLRWGGVDLRAVWEQLIAPRVASEAGPSRLRLVGADGFSATLPLEDALREGVMVATALDGAPLCRGHGAPVRVVAPAHYGYKSVKYLERIEVLGPADRQPRVSLRHPRGLVDREERFVGLPLRTTSTLNRRVLMPLTMRWYRRVVRG